jgi:hypothetical protein
MEGFLKFVFSKMNWAEEYEVHVCKREGEELRDEKMFSILK